MWTLGSLQAFLHSVFTLFCLTCVYGYIYAHPFGSVKTHSTPALPWLTGNSCTWLFCVFLLWFLKTVQCILFPEDASHFFPRTTYRPVPLQLILQWPPHRSNDHFSDGNRGQTTITTCSSKNMQGHYMFLRKPPVFPPAVTVKLRMAAQSPPAAAWHGVLAARGARYDFSHTNLSKYNTMFWEKKKPRGAWRIWHTKPVKH